jgi:colanic acid/amylovoran biosynthesis protein
MGKNKVLIVQSYNVNKGDNSVISVMLSSFSPYNWEISLSAFDPEKARASFGINAYEYLFSFRDMKLASSKAVFLVSALKEVAWLFYSLFVLLALKMGISLLLPRRKKNLVNAYREADVVVLPGGHFFTSFNSLINNFSHYYAMRFAQLLGKKTMVYSQTIGPYKSSISGTIIKWMGDRVLKRCDVVTVREQDSLGSYNGKNVRLTAETVFLEPILKTGDDVRKYIPEGKTMMIIGCTIHHLYYKHYYKKKEYVDKMVDIFNQIIDRYNCNLLIIPMEDNIKQGGDRPIIKEMISLVDKKERVMMVSDDLNSMQTANIISQTDVFIGTKTHSIVYGLKTSTPTIAIAYQQKSTEFMKMFGVEEYSIPMAELNTVKFMEIFENIVKHKDQVKLNLKERYADVSAKAEENTTILKQLLDA